MVSFVFHFVIAAIIAIVLGTGVHFLFKKVFKAKSSSTVVAIFFLGVMPAGMFSGLTAAIKPSVYVIDKEGDVAHYISYWADSYDKEGGETVSIKEGGAIINESEKTYFIEQIAYGTIKLDEDRAEGTIEPNGVMELVDPIMVSYYPDEQPPASIDAKKAQTKYWLYEIKE